MVPPRGRRRPPGAGAGAGGVPRQHVPQGDERGRAGVHEDPPLGVEGAVLPQLQGEGGRRRRRGEEVVPRHRRVRGRAVAAAAGVRGEVGALLRGGQDAVGGPPGGLLGRGEGGGAVLLLPGGGGDREEPEERSRAIAELRRRRRRRVRRPVGVVAADDEALEDGPRRGGAVPVTVPVRGGGNVVAAFRGREGQRGRGELRRVRRVRGGRARGVAAEAEEEGGRRGGLPARAGALSRRHCLGVLLAPNFRGR